VNLGFFIFVIFTPGFSMAERGVGDRI